MGKLIVVTRSQKDAQLDPVTGKDYLEYCDGHKVDPNVTRPQGGWVIDPEKFEGHPKSKEGEVIYDDKGRPKRIFPDAYDLAMRQARRMANSRPGATIREVEGPGVVGHADGAPRLPYIGPVPLEQYPGGPPTGQAPQPEPAAAEPVPDHQKPSKRRGKKKVSALTIGKIEYVDYKDTDLLRKFVSERAKIKARRISGNDAGQQRHVARAVKNAREMALIPYTNRVTTQRRERRGDDRAPRADGPPPRPTAPPPGSTGDAEFEAVDETTLDAVDIVMDDNGASEVPEAVPAGGDQ